MTDISGVLKLAFRFLVNEACSKISERLNDGDVTDEKCQRLIVRELDDIQQKLDGLARKDLVSSFRFLQEGINGLYQSLQQFKASDNGPESIERATLAEARSSKETGAVSEINDVMTLINALNSLKIYSKERFESAIESFKLARQNATKAFSDEALSIEDRIQAAQVRMMARILEKLEDPDAGVSDCLQYLKQLHDIQAIQKIFSVVIDSGIKSRFNKTKRLSYASCICQMNLLLFEFASRFTNLRTVFFDWPRILLGEKTRNPLIWSDRLFEKCKKSGVKITSPYPDSEFPKEIDQSCSVVNSKREIVAKTEHYFVQILKPSGECRTINDLFKQKNASHCEVVAMDIDTEDNLYVIAAFYEDHHQSYSFNLFVFDEHGDKKLQSLLPFYCGSAYNVPMAVNNDKKIAVLDPEKKNLRVGTSCKSDSFEVDNSFYLHDLSGRVGEIRFLDNSGTKIIVAGDDRNRFYIYTENGKLDRKVMIPEEYGDIHSIAINYIMKRILVKTGGRGVLYLCSFSETGELKDNVYLGSVKKCRSLYFAKVISNQHGAVALVGDRRVIFLQR